MQLALNVGITAFPTFAVKFTNKCILCFRWKGGNIRAYDSEKSITKGKNTMAMRISIDKEYTAPYEYAHVKDDIKAFSDGVTIRDIIAHFLGNIEMQIGNFEIIHYTVRAFSGGWAHKNNMTCYVVEAVLEGWEKLYKVRFYIDQDWEVNITPGWYKFITYGIEAEK